MPGNTVEQERLEQAIAVYIAIKGSVVNHQVDVLERRGDEAPDIQRLKLRNS